MSALAKEEAGWRAWRGTPELLAQTMRSALRAVSADDETCKIDIEVDKDHELFASPDEFVAKVTREALRRFREMSVCASGKKGEFELLFTRDPWWIGLDGSPEAEVKLVVRGRYLTEVTAAFKAISASLRRGRSLPVAHRKWVVLPISYSVGLSILTAGASALFLLGVSRGTINWIIGVLLAVGLIVGGLWGSWLYPPLEIARHGQTNLSRVVKFGGPLVVGFVLSGLVKLAFG